MDNDLNRDLRDSEFSYFDMTPEQQEALLNDFASGDTEPPEGSALLGCLAFVAIAAIAAGVTIGLFFLSFN